MAWRIAEFVVRGEVDNRRKDCVTGRIWLVGNEAPLELELQGNALRDLAGCHLAFTNLNPKPGNESGLARLQAGIVGDMTASRKVRVLDVSTEEALNMSKLGRKPPEHLANSIYLEWYGDANGRIVIESADFQMTISEPEWKMSATEMRLQRSANAVAAQRWLTRLTNLADAAERRREIDAKKDQSPIAGDDAAFDEFAWEKFLKETDARNELHARLLEKYKDMDRESRERLVAREMGWTHIEEYLDAKAGGKLKEDDAGFDGMEELPELEPDPLTEGVDWIRNADGHIQHPLVDQATEIAIGMWRDCKQKGLMGEDGPRPVSDMVSCAQTLSAKLAGALNGLAHDYEPDDGFVVACLKRALQHMNDTLRHCGEVQERQLVAPERLAKFKSDLYAVREGILRLMEKHRG